MRASRHSWVLGRGSWVVGLALALLPVAAPPAGAAVISRSTEISLGREAAQDFERVAVVDNDPFLTAKVRRIGARLVSVSDDPSYPYEFHFVDSSVVNAFALPGGFIYMYRGLVQLLPNDDALAFVLAHEITHVTRRHSVRQLEKNLLISTLLNALLPSRTGADVLELVLGMHYSRADETEADTRGLVMMAKAGFDPNQGAEAMKVIRRAAGSGRGIPKLLRSHPAPDDRIARLSRQATQIKAEYARQAPPPDPDAPTPRERLASLPTATIPGLDDVDVAACRYFPLKPGARWRYRTSGEAGTGQMSMTVLEMVPGTPEGVYRVEMNLGRGVSAVQWITTTPDRVLRREGESDRWSVEFAFPDTPEEADVATAAGAVVTPAAVVQNEAEGDLCGGRPSAAVAGTKRALPVASEPSFRAVARETLRVPAGEYEALKVESLSPAGEVTATCWFAPGVGLVKRVSRRSGTTQELETVHMPPDPVEATPDTDAAGEAGAKEQPSKEPSPEAEGEPDPARARDRDAR